MGLDDGRTGELLGTGITGFVVTAPFVGGFEDTVGVPRTVNNVLFVGVYVGNPKLGPRGAVHFCCNLGKMATPPIMIARDTTINRAMKIFRFVIWMGYMQALNLGSEGLYHQWVGKAVKLIGGIIAGRPYVEAPIQVN